ncbi:MAG TPA: hypothetical protein VIK91_25610 [Nannocystis sp.]
MLTRALAFVLALMAAPALAAPVNPAAATRRHEDPGRPSDDATLQRKGGQAMFGIGVGYLLAGGFGLGVIVWVGSLYREEGRELEALAAKIKAQGGRTPKDDRLLNSSHLGLDSLRSIMMVTGLAAAFTLGVGSWLVATNAKHVRRARVSPYGSPHEVGLSLVGRF